MNQRNIDALQRVILEGMREMGEQLPRWTESEISRALALRLATHGVLVPSALTDQQVEYATRRHTQFVSEALESLARGDTEYKWDHEVES